ncbi:hypothetical protein NCCP1664_26390 [Zafaria cholistanensis]|uniref:Uncharacterized protein n=1 Tax=Zafaria cholistanensis TaxID=1682741 RepID=A0A5A7NTD6_9MICC|nr:hypothetical protein [Zafaria cholistanensis]GER24144.1 hypothetical protein NCCP1664_26390 [Zafaria cholistanensis]
MSLEFAGPEPGRWIVEDLAQAATGPEVAATVAGQVPARFAAYARIFHPATDDDGRPVRWAEVAAARGTVLHGEAQFTALSGLSEYGEMLVEDAWEGEPPSGTGLPQPDLAVLAGILARHTSTPEEVYLGLWNGFAFIHGGDAVALLSAADAGEADPAVLAGQRALEEEAKKPAFGPEVIGGPTLDLAGGYRSYYVFRGTMKDLANPLWKRYGHIEERQAPNLAWPADRAWLVSSELYEDSTIVAGSTELVRELSAAPGLEVRTVVPGSRLDLHGDGINPMPEMPGY